MRFEQGSELAKSHAQHHEDVTAHEKYFWGVKGGTFLEIGALDGLEISTSLMLEESADWRSVLIEASPGQFSRCRRNRPKALALNFAACSQARTIHYLDANAISEGRGAGGGIIEFMPTRMMRNNFGNVPALVAHLDLTGDDNVPSRITNAAALEALSYVQTVKCEPISPVLLSYGVDHISMWVLDVEGAELEVLQAFDFSLVTVDVIAFENSDASLTNARFKAKDDILTKAGFRRDTSLPDGNSQNVANHWYVRQGFEPRAKPA